MAKTLNASFKKEKKKYCSRKRRRKKEQKYDNDHKRQTKMSEREKQIKGREKNENKQNQREENLFFNGTRALYLSFRLLKRREEKKIGINALCVCALYEIQSSLKSK